MIDKSSLTFFDSFEDADKADREERWSMTIEERLIAQERLRSYLYEDGKTAPRLQRLLELAEFPQR